jgi:hypothetical protein
MRTAQISMEYLIIIGFVMFILIPLLLFYADFSKETHDQVLLNEVSQVARKIADEAETVYFVGDPAKTKMRIYLPEDLVNATLTNQEIVLILHVYGGDNEVVIPTKVMMNGSLPTTKGNHDLYIKAKGNWVEIT